MQNSDVNQIKTTHGSDAAIAMFMKNFLGTLNCLHIYPKEHTIVKESFEKLYVSTDNIFANDKEIIIAIFEGDLIVNKFPMMYLQTDIKVLMDRLIDLKIEKFTFTSSIIKDHIKLFIEFIASEKGALDLEEQLSDVIGETIIIKKNDAEDVDNADDITNLNSQVVLFRDIVSKFRITRKLDISDITGVVNSINKNLNAFDEKVSEKLLEVDNFDEYTYVHSVNVATLTIAFARTLGFGKEICNELGTAGLLHDIGKEFIPYDILRKPGKLSDEEAKLMNNHPLIGVKVLTNTVWVTGLVTIIAFEHHMKYDLTGYPKIPGKKSINPFTMLVTIADFYDALSSNRPYRVGLKPEVVLNIMKEESGTLFDPKLLDIFIKMVDQKKYHVGSLVMLTSGEIGVINKLPGKENKYIEINVIIDCEGNKPDKTITVKDADGTLIEKALSSG